MRPLNAACTRPLFSSFFKKFKERQPFFFISF
jgi:hypothetical protein